MNLKHLERSLVSYGNIAKLMVDDVFEKQEGNKQLWLALEERLGDKPVIWVCTYDKTRKKPKHSESSTTSLEDLGLVKIAELTSWIECNLDMRKVFLRKWKDLGYNLSTIESTKWLYDLLNCNEFVANKVPEFRAINIVSKFHSSMRNVINNPALEEGREFTVGLASGDEIVVGKKPNGDYWSSTLYQDFLEINTSSNLELSRIYLTECVNKTKGDYKREQLSYLSDFKPVAVRFKNIPFQVYDKMKGLAGTVFNNCIEVPAITTRGGVIQEDRGVVIYVPKGVFADELGVYPNIFNGDISYCFMSCILNRVFSRLIKGKHTKYYQNTVDKKVMNQEDYIKKVAEGLIDPYNYVEISWVRLAIMEGYGKFDRTANFSDRSLTRKIDMVVDTINRH